MDEGQSARAAAPTDQIDVHLFTAITRSGQWLSAITGCGKNMRIRQPDGPLSGAGLSAWSREITCTPCRARLGLDINTGVAAA